MTPLAGKAAIAILLLAAAGPTFAQENKQPPAPRVKIALVNYGYLFINYDRAKELKKELDDALKPLKDEAEKIKTSLTGLKAAADSAKEMPEVVALLQEQMKEGVKSLEDLDAKARKMVGKRQEEQLAELWKDINEAIAEYA